MDAHSTSTFLGIYFSESFLALLSVSLLQTILDLRRMDRPCKREPGGNKAAQSTKMVIKYVLLVSLLLKRLSK